MESGVSFLRFEAVKQFLPRLISAVLNIAAICLVVHEQRLKFKVP